MYTATVFLEDFGPFPSFKDACKVAVEKIKEKISQGKCSFQALETTCWVKPPSGSPVDFCAFRDICCNEGWIVDGHWVG